MTTNGDFGNTGQSEESDNGPNGFPMPKNLGIDTKMKSPACSEPKLQFRLFYLILNGRNGHKWPFWPLRSIGGVWKWSQWISHTQKPGDRHQNQVSSMFGTLIMKLAFIPLLWPHCEPPVGSDYHVKKSPGLEMAWDMTSPIFFLWISPFWHLRKNTPDTFACPYNPVGLFLTWP